MNKKDTEWKGRARITFDISHEAKQILSQVNEIFPGYQGKILASLAEDVAARIKEDPEGTLIKIMKKELRGRDILFGGSNGN